MAAVPDRLEDPVAEPEDQQVADGLLARGSGRCGRPATRGRPCRPRGSGGSPTSRSWPNGFSMTIRRQPPSWRSWSRPHPAELGDDLGERRRLGREVVEVVAARSVPALRRSPRAASRADRTPSASSKSSALVARSAPRSPPGRPRRAAGPASTSRASPRTRPESFDRVRPPADGRAATNSCGSRFVRQQLVERRHDLAVGEVAGRAEQDDDAGVRDALEAQAVAERVRRLP